MDGVRVTGRPPKMGGSDMMQRNKSRVYLIDPDDEEKVGCLWVLLEGIATTSIIVMGVMMVYRYIYGG
jgi:hypothetical protein